MIKVNSLSGGKTSSYIGVNYPADYNVFSLVRTNDKLCKYPDKKVRQIVSDLIGCEFVGTPEQDNIINIMLNLSEKIDVTWLSGKTFEDIIRGGANNRGKNGKYYLPNIMVRYCTTHLKIKPIFEWWQKEINQVCEMRIGFRKGEEKRANRMLSKLNTKGNEEIKVVIGKHKNNNNKWGVVEWRKPKFPLIDDNISAIDINKFWNKNNYLGFNKGYYNNCVGCFHRSPLFLNKMAKEHKNKMEWFAKIEEENSPNTFRKDVRYRQIMNWKPQAELSFEDFNECDSGFCGL
jgi:hypothetical protein